MCLLHATLPEAELKTTFSIVKWKHVFFLREVGFIKQKSDHCFERFFSRFPLFWQFFKSKQDKDYLYNNLGDIFWLYVDWFGLFHGLQRMNGHFGLFTCHQELKSKASQHFSKSAQAIVIVTPFARICFADSKEDVKFT